MRDITHDHIERCYPVKIDTPPFFYSSDSCQPLFFFARRLHIRFAKFRRYTNSQRNANTSRDHEHCAFGQLLIECALFGIFFG